MDNFKATELPKGKGLALDPIEICYINPYLSQSQTSLGVTEPANHFATFGVFGAPIRCLKV